MGFELYSRDELPPAVREGFDLLDWEVELDWTDTA
jgi:hypothetical protein